MTGLLVFFLALTIVITWHELGHYVACRAFGIPVDTFSVGIGPKLLSVTDRRGTTWKLAPFLFGGYIMPDSDRMIAAPAYQKFIVAAGGPFFNFIAVVVPLVILGGADKIGVLMGLLWGAYLEGFGALWHIAIKPFVWVASWFHTVEPVKDAVSGYVGPVGMAQAATHMPEGGAVFVGLLILLNLGIMLFNLLPVPGLDGGRMTFAVLEGLFGRARTKRIETVATIAGGLFILYIFIVLIFSDFSRLLS
jgi:membrane-associated protease RseP (regulator of RpoE activity)